MEERYLICINNIARERFYVLQDYSAVGIPVIINELYALTIGHRYEGIGLINSIEVINDLGKKQRYPSELFKIVTKSEIRDDKINKILNR